MLFVLYHQPSPGTLGLTLHTLVVALRVRHQHQQGLSHDGVLLAGVLLTLQAQAAHRPAGGGDGAGGGQLRAHLDARHVITSVPVDDYLGPHRRWNNSRLIFGIFYLR